MYMPSFDYIISAIVRRADGYKDSVLDIHKIFTEKFAHVDEKKLYLIQNFSSLGEYLPGAPAFAILWCI